MTDLISRQAAIEALKNRWKKTRNYEGIGDDIAEECELYLKQVPSAQPEIIRCKDCVYFTPEKSGEHWNICRFYDAPKTADGYCNDAERKEE